MEVLHLSGNAVAATVASHLLKLLDPLFERAHEACQFVERAHVNGLPNAFELRRCVDQFALVAIAGGQDHRLGNLQSRLSLRIDVFAVTLHVNLVAAAKLSLREHAIFVKQSNVLGRRQHGKRFGSGFQVGQPTPLGLHLPFLRVAVAVENHCLMLGNNLLQQNLEGCIELR